MNPVASFGAQIRTLRESANMPLRKLAALLDIDQSTLSKIERNERKANVKMIDKLVKIFDVRKKDLLVSFYSDVVLYEIEEEKDFSEILQAAEAKIIYHRTLKNKTKK